MQILETLRQNMTEARLQSALAVDSPILLGASKGHSAEVIAPFIEAGLTDFGENRVQEASDKWPALRNAYPHVRLHLIGPLQTNKLREALALFDVIQTLDRPKLAEAIIRELENSKIRETEKKQLSNPRILESSNPQFYIQVNTGEEPQKAGVSPKDAPDFIAYCRGLGLNIVGLMCVPPAHDMPAPHFALLRKIAQDNGLNKLSMGMSGDYETAIRMGSSCVRIGTALFGKRL